MNKFICIIIFTIVSLSLYAQEENCDFGSQAQNYIDKGTKLIGLSYAGKTELLNAAKEFEQALKYNPKCEDIYLTLAEIYTKIGNSGIRDIQNCWDVRQCKEQWQFVKSNFSKAQFYLRKVINSNNYSIQTEANQSLRQIYSIENTLENQKSEKIKTLKHQADLEKNTDGFFSLGVGYGSVLGQSGQMGVRASLFTQSKAGIGIVGGVGYPVDYNSYNDPSHPFEETPPPLLWFVGGGWSFGSYKCTFQLLGLYGKIQTRENFYENTGGLTLASNIKLFSDFALSLDVGYWLSDTSETAAIFSFSAGLCYRFRF